MKYPWNKFVTYIACNRVMEKLKKKIIIKMDGTSNTFHKIIYLSAKLFLL